MTTEHKEPVSIGSGVLGINQRNTSTSKPEYDSNTIRYDVFAGPKNAILESEELLKKLDKKIKLRGFRYRLKATAVDREWKRGECFVPDIGKPKVSGRVKCRRIRHSLEGVDLVSTKGNGVGLQGVGRCNSIAECPICAASQAAKRAKELEIVVKNFGNCGGTIYMATLTMRHKYGDDLASLRKALTDSWSKVWSGKSGVLCKKRLDLEGTVRALEVTHGRNGWHPHLHVLLFTRRELSKKETLKLEAWIWHRWKGQALKHDLLPPIKERAVKVDRAHDAGYVTKMGLSDEVANAYKKEGRNGNRTPWQILAGAANKNRHDGYLWDCWVKGMRGARWLFYSRHLKTRFLIEKKPEKEKEDKIWYFGPAEWDSCDYDSVLKIVNAGQLAKIFNAPFPLGLQAVGATCV